jgi:hypothetical protein
MPLSPEDFVERLNKISVHDDIAFGRLSLLAEEEQKHQDAFSRYKGYFALSNAFKCFFLETVELLNRCCRPKVTVPLSESYTFFVSRLVHNFQSVCGAERVAILGYPLHGYTIFRNIFDNLVLTSAILQGITDIYKIEGVEPSKPIDPKIMKKLRIKEEFNVRKKMTGNHSGLSKETIKQLTKYDALFDFEVHGSRLSLAADIGWIKGDSPLPILPIFNIKKASMFINRYCEVGWMTHRLIPAIQPSGVLLPKDWEDKWKVLDNSFQIVVAALTKECDKKIGEAFIEFMNVKFPFNPKYTFPH